LKSTEQILRVTEDLLAADVIPDSRSQSFAKPDIAPLSPARLAAAKPAFTTRRVDLAAARSLLSGDIAPQPGDLVLARVDKIGQHTRIELPSGRRARMFTGDEIIVAYGNRYAPSQFEAEVPGDLGPCHLVAGGGVAARIASRHARVKRPTAIRPLGLLARRDGERLNLRDWALPAPARRSGPDPAVIAVVGTSMNAGKTTTAAGLIRGFCDAGLRVAAAKLTGTGSGGDLWHMADAGADPVVDFTDAGHASTFQISAAELDDIASRLIGHIAASGADVLVLEVADGLLQKETATLLSSDVFSTRVHAIVFAAGEAMGAAHGVDWLRTRNLPVLAISGVVSSAPLAVRECAAATGLPVLSRRDLCRGETIAPLLLRPRQTRVNSL